MREIKTISAVDLNGNKITLNKKSKILLDFVNMGRTDKIDKIDKIIRSYDPWNKTYKYNIHNTVFSVRHFWEWQYNNTKYAYRLEQNEFYEPIGGLN
jgi:hypothetical protein